ncbi:arginase [Cohnella nanjingensis]|uniref:Arginase n=1 Tax=Cohnella nanjingensis TaxID=1387779 RepID=A0A7X0VDZ7_9BACL|nr:arginase [Cohnella nanjingensis]MBB6669743.1 arginase [Cohnella nanjingensis]
MAKRKIVDILPVAFDLGASRRGAAGGPQAMLQAGLAAKLRQLRLPYRIQEELNAGPAAAEQAADPALAQRPRGRPPMKHLAAAVAVNEALAARVSAAAAAGRWPLILGGDHSIAIGTIAGLASHYRRLGMLWIDAHSDMNTDLTTPSGNIHGMSLAASIGLGASPLTAIGGRIGKIRPERVALVGARSLDPEEKRLIRALGVSCFTMHDIDKRGIASVMEEAVQIVGADTDGVHVSFDIDSLDPRDAPGTGTPVGGGLSSREAFLALELIAEAGVATSAEFVEVNPEADPSGCTAELAVSLIGSLLGDRIL